MMKVAALIIIFSINAFADTKFVSLRGRETNMRNGPSEEYKILMTYYKTKMPLEVMHKVDDWFMVRDFNQNSGWVISRLVSSNKKARTIILNESAYLCKLPVTDIAKCVILKKMQRGLVANLKKCNSAWCRIVIEEEKISGWVLRYKLFGILQDERI